MQGGLQPATCVPSRAMLLSGRTLFPTREMLHDGDTATLKVANPQPAAWAPPVGGARVRE
jgi:arylsulfatase A-like enzyme